MVPSRFSLKRGPRKGVSELYASMLMVGVTLSLGSVVLAAALGAFNQSAGAESMGTSLQESASGVQVSLVYAAVAPSGSCPAYGGAREGTSLSLALFDYGTVGFAPTELTVNSTVYQGSFPAVSPGAMRLYTITLGTCAHHSGQSIGAVDAEGDEVQFDS